MMLGDLLAAARDSAAVLERWLGARDDDILDQCLASAQEEGQSLNRWLAGSVAWFERYASSDDWASLTSRMMGSDAPGQDCLMAIIEQRLAHRTCRTSQAGAEAESAS
ncbi:hypothetical protein ACXYL9_10235 [Qipengyuania sp. CAU 1752]